MARIMPPSIDTALLIAQHVAMPYCDKVQTKVGSAARAFELPRAPVKYSAEGPLLMPSS